MTKTDRYLKVVKWAQKRYRNADGSVTVSYGGDRLLSAYTAIEFKAWGRYMGADAAQLGNV